MFLITERLPSFDGSLNTLRIICAVHRPLSNWRFIVINDEMICVVAYRTIDCVKRDGSSYPVAVHIGARSTIENRPDKLSCCKYRLERPGFAINKLVAGEDPIHALYTSLVPIGN